MNDTEPKEQPTVTPTQRIGVHTIALVVSCVILILAAFVVGMLVARQTAERLSDDRSDVENVDDREGDEDDASIDGVVVDWDSAERGTEHPFNFYLRQWWETEMVSGQIADSDDVLYEYTATIIDTIQGGLYDGYYLVDNEIVEQYGIGGFSGHYYLLVRQKSDYNAIVLTRHSYSEGWSFDGAMTYDIDAPGLKTSDMKLDGFIDVEESLKSEDGATTFALLGTNGTYSDPIEYSRTVATTSGITIYESLEGTFFFMQPDDRAVWYDANVMFWDPKEEGSSVTTPSIVWNDGAEVSEYMKGEVGGCGFVNPTHVVAESELPVLKVTGRAQADSSIKLYEPADYAEVEDGNEYGNWKNYVMQTAEGEADTSIEAFAAEHPTFYYKDALGRWIMFMTTKSAPAGECGKPVIYLYPETTTRLDVSLAPQGGFTKSEPAYDGGWHVIAQPDGMLTNLADGLTYPYLFWEGRGGLYAEPTKFWVVARDDVHGFLVTTLAKLGLNVQETADFMEFWEPRMQAAPFYKIGFHGTNVMNVIAQMTLSETPDTMLRILMDYSELAAPIPSNPPTLGPTPTRTGFTVIEWGGVIR